MDPANILRLMTNSTWMVTRLVSGGSVQFSQDVYQTEVQENGSPGPILQLSVSVPSESDVVNFQIQEGNDNNYFKIDSKTGKLWFLKPLDYETRQEYDLIVEARVGQARNSARIIVKVLDKNDHQPVFSRAKYETQITEEDDRDLPKEVLTVAAHDGDAGVHGELKYILSGDGTLGNSENPFFSINPKSGSLFVLRPLDRDPPTGKPQWVLQVTATDGTRKTTTTITVNVKDINDNQPIFESQHITASLKENSREGEYVTQVFATDNDDPEEGLNAILTYSLEKNVIDESTGRPIFVVDKQNGQVLTTICCLDREKTQQYTIQVVATDGGGLKGTGTVVVEVDDENDSPPRFESREWHFNVDEESPKGAILATLPIIDPDVKNDLAFRVVPRSGRNWQMFDVETSASGESGILLAKPLDYENKEHREGFKFVVQVTDKGPSSWNDRSHIDQATVHVSVSDVNDNTPVFTKLTIYNPRPRDSYSPFYAQLTLDEDTPIGTKIASFNAEDDDQDGNAPIEYKIDPTSDPNRLFKVDNTGIVTIASPLDRESNSKHEVIVWVTDTGSPALSSSAVLVVDLSDVNDNPPELEEPSSLTILEESQPQEIGKIYLTDKDIWQLGNGPPFRLELDSLADSFIHESIDVRFRQNAGPKRVGEGTVSTKVVLDREETPEILVPIIVSDSRGLSATVTLTVHVQDVNDNEMKPGKKIAHVIRTDLVSGTIPLGTVHVDDEDDSDSSSKSYSWDNKHPDFQLNPSTGFLLMLPQATKPRYNLHFLVTDNHHKQENVPAEVEVNVIDVPSDFLTLTLSIVTDAPADKLTIKVNDNYTHLEILIETVRNILSNYLDETDVTHREEEYFKINLKGLNKRQKLSNSQLSRNPIQFISVSHSNSNENWSRVWLTIPDVVNVAQLIHYNRFEIKTKTGLTVKEVLAHTQSDTKNKRLCDDRKISQESDAYSLIDMQETSYVGINMENFSRCQCQQTRNENCFPNPCYNGGRCLPNANGFKCICPSGTQGRYCKILSRYFEGGVYDGGGFTNEKQEPFSFSWISPLSFGNTGYISLQIKTNQTEALLIHWNSLYSVGLSDTTQEECGASGNSKTSAPKQYKDMMTIELESGQPKVLLIVNGELLTIHLREAKPIVDGSWHTISISWHEKTVTLELDHCMGQSPDELVKLNLQTRLPSGAHPDLHKQSKESCREERILSYPIDRFHPTSVMSLGGISYSELNALQAAGFGESIKSHSFQGCIKNLRFNEEVQDLGYSLKSHNSSPKCKEDVCKNEDVCEDSKRCQKPLVNPDCPCPMGWTGAFCDKRTLPVTFHPNSFITIAVMFSSFPYSTSLQLRLRTRELDGSLIRLMGEGQRLLMDITLSNGFICSSIYFPSQIPSKLCLLRNQVNDGKWHAVVANRQGSMGSVAIDDGEDGNFNYTNSLDYSAELVADKKRTLHIGGAPEVFDKEVYLVKEDLQKSCIDDVRYQGVPIPLAVERNNSRLTKIVASHKVTENCVAPSTCNKVQCQAPLTCMDSWRSYECRCLEGKILTRGGPCRDINECIWSPCLHGAACLNSDPGYSCSCHDGFTGRNCESLDSSASALPLTVGALVAILAWCCLLVVLCCFFVHQHNKKSRVQSGRGRGKDDEYSKDATPSTDTMNFDSYLELNLTKIPIMNESNGQLNQISSKNMNVTMVQVKPADGSTENPLKRKVSLKSRIMRCLPSKKCEMNGHSTDVRITRNGEEDLRFYAYEGDGSSPGSLSSCLESCNGSFKFLGGFREVAQFLETNDEKVEMNGNAKQNGHIQKRSASKTSLSRFSASESTMRCDDDSNCCYTPNKSSSINGRSSPCSDCYMNSKGDGSPFVISPGSLSNISMNS